MSGEADGFAVDRQAEFRRLGAELRRSPGDWGLLVRARFAAPDAGLRWEAIGHFVRAYRAGPRTALMGARTWGLFGWWHAERLVKGGR